MLLPIGLHQARGILGNQVSIDSFLPLPHFFVPTFETFPIIPDTRFHLFSFVTAPTSENFTRMMLYTVQANITSDFKFWVIDGFRSGLPRSVDTQIIPRFWPFFLPEPNDVLSFFKVAKFILLDLLFPLEVKNILFLDQGTILRGNVAIFKKFDLEDAVCAAPIISSSQEKTHYWNIHEFIVQRFKRPFHTTAFVWIDLDRWREQKAGDIYRNLYRAAILYHQPVGQIDDDLFNQMQMDVQVITLPENTAFCPRNNHRDLAGAAFAHMICDSESIEMLGKEYDELREAAAIKY
jgi:UDP-glucose:glycoprotein glucosyltransferase